MAAFIDKLQFRMRDQFIEFMRHRWWGDGIIQTPNQASGHFDISNFTCQVMPLGCLGNRNNIQTFWYRASDVKYFIDQFLWMRFRDYKRYTELFP